jgi:putative restriction endonuclease
MSNAKGKPWTKDELLLAINLYCRTPFGRIHIHNPDIIELAQLLDRTPGSISYKLANFACLDPSLPRKGASNVSKLDREVWDEFYSDWATLAFESETRTHAARGKELDQPEETTFPAGRTRESLVRTRVNQGFFRKMILASYDCKCCITNLSIGALLVASHIVPWAIDNINRMNPRNGLCLNALHDRAFDSGLITISESNRVVLSRSIRDIPDNESKILRDYDGVEIRMPHRFMPDQSFLAHHRDQVFCA